MLLEGVLALRASGACCLRRRHIAIAVAGLRLDSNRLLGRSMALELLFVWIRETLGHDREGFLSWHGSRGGGVTLGNCASQSVREAYIGNEGQRTVTRVVGLVPSEIL